MSVEANRFLKSSAREFAYVTFQFLIDVIEFFKRPRSVSEGSYFLSPSLTLRVRYKIQETMFDFLIVGAGFAGSVLAERLARDSNKKVLLVDKRSHIAGNAYDCTDKAGVLIHKYGPHIFHTNSKDVFDYLSRFTAWRQYQHRVLAHARCQERDEGSTPACSSREERARDAL